MAKEYIPREVAIETFEQAFDNNWEVSGTLDRIRAIPAADVVEVVRCRECKYRAEDDFCIGRGWPDRLVADDGFCEKGKRKGGGQDDGCEIERQA